MKFDNKNKPLLFAHVGDLHITRSNEQNYRDFLAITAQLAVEAEKFIDFVVLPGDNADNGLAAQYRLIKPVLKMLSVPVYVLSGDHDMEQGDLSNFYTELQATKLPFCEYKKGVQCIFLDVSGNGKGGPDFQLGDEQINWFRSTLHDAAGTGKTRILFMHTYPDDLKNELEKKEIISNINNSEVALVDMGHTHYNELGNNGITVYSAVRSTGQIEEGPVGYSFISIDNGVVSWRFKTLEEPFPFVMITYPADRRLARKEGDSVITDTDVRATVIGDTAIKQVKCFINGAEGIVMDFDSERNDWFVRLKLPTLPIVKICVEAISIDGRPGRHQIEFATAASKPYFTGRDGSDGLSIGAWTDNGIPGTQLGPNRNAKPQNKK